MSEQSPPPDDRPKTINVDALITWPSLSGAVPFLGFVFAVGGFLLRCWARWFAWPSQWSYSGDRQNTEWAYREHLYADLGLVALVFGLSLIWLAIARRKPS
jgi:hypothetical protein